VLLRAAAQCVRSHSSDDAAWRGSSAHERVGHFGALDRGQRADPVCARQRRARRSRPCGPARRAGRSRRAATRAARPDRRAPGPRHKLTRYRPAAKTYWTRRHRRTGAVPTPALAIDGHHHAVRLRAARRPGQRPARLALIAPPEAERPRRVRIARSAIGEVISGHLRGHSHQRVPRVTDADREVGGPRPRLRLTRSPEARRR
jgi:hypothetical protein